MARKQDNFILAEADQQALEALLRSHKTPQSRALRARIVLKSGAGESVESIATSLDTSTKSVYKWRNRYIESGLDGLFDLPRSGQPKKLTEAKIKEVLTLTVERIPHEATHWSVRLMAKYAGITTWQVRQIWEAADLKPHRIQTFKISNDPLFAEKVIQMKKVLSTLVAALVAVSFAGIVCAAEVKTETKSEATTTSPAGEVKVEKKTVKKTVKKHKKHKEAMKKAVAPVETTTTTTTPAAETPAAK